MKRLASFDAPDLDELLKLAASFDEGRLKLEAHELHDLLNRILAFAHAKLGKNCRLGVGSASLEKDLSGNVTVGLKRLGIWVEAR